MGFWMATLVLIGIFLFPMLTLGIVLIYFGHWILGLIAIFMWVVRIIRADS